MEDLSAVSDKRMSFDFAFRPDDLLQNARDEVVVYTRPPIRFENTDVTVNLFDVIWRKTM